MLTLTNPVTLVGGFNPDSREAEQEWERDAAIERLTDEIHTWSVAELIERSSRLNVSVLDEVITDTAACVYDAAEAARFYRED